MQPADDFPLSSPRATPSGATDDGPEDATDPLCALLGAARRLADATDEDALACLAATQVMTSRHAPPPLQVSFTRLQARLARDPACRARYDRLLRRMQDLRAQCEPHEHFERLTAPH